ncbi:MAG: hypothetical protein ACJ8GW_04010, partial [Massilia sp.]
LSLVLPGTSQAQAPQTPATVPTPPAAPRTALMSLIGDSIMLAQHRDQTGTRMEPDARNIIPITDTVFDNAAVQAANTALKRIEPSVQTVMMLTQDTGLYKAQNDMFDAVEANKDNREFLKSLLKARNVDRLILVTKFRADAQLKLANSYTGSGHIEGLGFYIDDALNVLDLGTRNTALGILAPFAYVKLRLIDGKTLAVLAEKTVRQSHVVPNASATANGQYTWNILTGAQKIAYLDDLLGKAMDEGMPRLLAK